MDSRPSAICPTCGRALTPDCVDAMPPFCSQRCKLVDLDSWFRGRYVVSEPLFVDESGGLLPTEEK